MSTCNPAILGTNSGGARGTFYGQNPSVGGSQVMHPDQNPPPIGGNGGDNGDEERGNRKRSGGEKGNSDDRGKIEKDKGRRKGKGRDGHN